MAGKRTEQEVAIQERRRKALELRKMGYSYREIGRAQDPKVSVRTAYKDVQAALEEMIREPAEEVRKLEAARLDELFKPLYAVATKKVDPNKNEEPNYQAVDRTLKVMERRAKLLGLDATPEDAGAAEEGPITVVTFVEVNEGPK